MLFGKGFGANIFPSGTALCCFIKPWFFPLQKKPTTRYFELKYRKKESRTHRFLCRFLHMRRIIYGLGIKPCLDTYAKMHFIPEAGIFYHTHFPTKNVFGMKHCISSQSIKNADRFGLEYVK